MDLVVDSLVDVDEELTAEATTALLELEEEAVVLLLLELDAEVPTQLVSLPACTVTESVYLGTPHQRASYSMGPRHDSRNDTCAICYSKAN